MASASKESGCARGGSRGRGAHVRIVAFFTRKVTDAPPGRGGHGRFHHWIALGVLGGGDDGGGADRGDDEPREANRTGFTYVPRRRKLVHDATGLCAGIKGQTSAAAPPGASSAARWRRGGGGRARGGPEELRGATTSGGPIVGTPATFYHNEVRRWRVTSGSRLSGPRL